MEHGLYGKWSYQKLEDPHTYRYKKLFELFTGQPPFDTFMITHPVLVRQMQEMESDVLPARWHNSWDTTKEKDSGTPEPPGYSLQEWLEEVYFNNAQKQDLTSENITRLGPAIGKLLHF